jgi:hypothetical protein
LSNCKNFIQELKYKMDLCAKRVKILENYIFKDVARIVDKYCGREMPHNYCIMCGAKGSEQIVQVTPTGQFTIYMCHHRHEWEILCVRRLLESYKRKELTRKQAEQEKERVYDSSVRSGTEDDE